MGQRCVINMNQVCHVRLTVHGKRQLQQYTGGPDYYKDEDEPGYHEFHLHQLLHIFGPKFYMGCMEVPFVGNNIEMPFISKKKGIEMDIKRPEGLKLGDEAKDKISGFQGIVVAITNWLNGCQRVTISPQELKDGKPIDNHTFDAEQIEIVKATLMPEPVPSGGPSIAPSRAADPC